MLEFLRGGIIALLKTPKIKIFVRFIFRAFRFCFGTDTGSFYYFHKEGTKV